MTKATLALATLALAVSACGTTARDASVTAAASSAAEATITDVVVTPTNGGINPAFFAVTVSGKVRVGGNSCQAQGVTAALEQTSQAGTVTIRAVVTGGHPHICPQLWSPVYQTVTLTVHASHAAVQRILVKNVNEFGTLVDADDLGRQNEVVFTTAAATPVNGGIDATAFAYEIKGTVIAGSNPCQAAARPVTLATQTIGHTIYVKAVRAPRTVDIMCTADFAPVEKVLSISVRGSGSAISAVIVKNVTQLGNDVNADDLAH